MDGATFFVIVGIWLAVMFKFAKWMRRNTTDSDRLMAAKVALGPIKWMMTPYGRRK